MIFTIERINDIYYIRHKGGKYFRFSYTNLKVAERVRGNLENGFSEGSTRAKQRLVFQFVEKLEDAKLLYLEGNASGSIL